MVRSIIFIILLIFGLNSNAQIIKEKEPVRETEEEILYETFDEPVAVEPVEQERKEGQETGSFGLNGKYGYKFQGRVIIEPQYQQIWKAENRNVFIAELNDKWGLIDTTNKVIIPFIYNSVMIIDEIDSLTVRVRGEGYKYGVLSAKNQIIIPVEYEHISYSLGYFFVESNHDNHALFDLKGKQLTDFIYKNFFELNSMYDYTCLKNDSIYTVLNHDASILLDSVLSIYSVEGFNYFNQMLKQPEDYHDYTKNQHVVFQNKAGKFGVFDFKQDDFILPQIYDDYRGENNLKFILSKNEKFGLVSIDHTIKIDFNYDSLIFDVQNEDYYGKVAIASKNDLLGLVNAESGQELTPFEYLSIESIYEGKYKAKTKAGHYVVIDEKGKVLNEGPFIDVGEFALGEAVVFTEDGIKFLKLDGKLKQNEIKPHNGYKTVREVFESFKAAMYSPDTTFLFEFCERMVPSMHIINFMERTGIEYQRFPKVIKQDENNINKNVQTFYENLNQIRLTYFQDKTPELDYRLGYDLSPRAYKASRIGRQYVELEIIITIGKDLTKITFDHCIIIEGYILSFSDSIRY